jgi:hypothetical protein
MKNKLRVRNSETAKGDTGIFKDVGTVSDRGTRYLGHVIE